MTQLLFHNKETLTFFFCHCVHLTLVISNVAAYWFLQGLGIFGAGHQLYLGLVLSLAGCDITPILMSLVLSFIDWHTSLFDVIWLSQDLETWWQVMILTELRWCLLLVTRSLSSMMSFPGCIILHVCRFNILSVALYNFVAYVLFPIIAFFLLISYLYSVYMCLWAYLFLSVGSFIS